jgi:hypothetical protein
VPETEAKGFTDHHDATEEFEESYTYALDCENSDYVYVLLHDPIMVIIHLQTFII